MAVIRAHRKEDTQQQAFQNFKLALQTRVKGQEVMISEALPQSEPSKLQ